MDELHERNKPGAVGRARALRRQMTEAERVLWARLRNRGLAGMKFRRQVPVGRFVADFACVEERIVVEVDGGQHAAEQQKDLERSKELAARGYRVLRFWNNDVLQNLSGVLTKIAAASHGEHPLTPTLSQREREGPTPTLSAGQPRGEGDGG